MEFSWKQIKAKLRVSDSSVLQDFIKNNDIDDDTIFEIDINIDELDFFEVTRHLGLIALTKQSNTIQDDPNDNLIEWIKYLKNISPEWMLPEDNK